MQFSMWYADGDGSWFEQSTAFHRSAALRPRSFGIREWATPKGSKRVQTSVLSYCELINGVRG